MSKKGKRTLNLEPQFRNFEVRGINEEQRTVELSFSSEEPYKRWWGIEILDHSTGSVNMERLNNSAPLLFNHKMDEVIGVVEFAKIENNRGLALVRFGNSEKAKEVFSDVVDGIMKNVSVGYQINEVKLESEKDGVETYRVTDWQPFEISIVSVPADNTVGVGRAEDGEKKEVRIINQKIKEDNKMDEIQEEIKNPNVDVKAIEENARNAENSRIREIDAIAKKHGFEKEGADAIAKGTTVTNFKSLVLEKLGEPKAIQTKSQDLLIGMDEKEIKKYSLQKALWALANPNDKRAQDDASYEYEVSVEAQRVAGVTASGILVPFDVFSRDLTVTGANSGAALIENSMGGMVELLKNKSAIMQLAEILPGLQGNLDFPVQESSTSGDEYAENETIVNSDLSITQKTMSPRRFAGGSNYSKQMLKQSSIAIENMIKNDLMGQIGLKIDADAISKILSTTGIGLVTIGTDGGSVTNGHIVDLETELGVDNADFGRLAYLLNARTRGYLKKTPIATGNPKMILDGADLNGYAFNVSNQIPSNLTKGTGTDLSALIFGNFQDLLVGLWGGLDLTVDIYTQELRKAGLVGIQADQFADTFVRRASSFAAIKDAKVIA